MNCVAEAGPKDDNATCDAVKNAGDKVLCKYTAGNYAVDAKFSCNIEECKALFCEACAIPLLKNDNYGSEEYKKLVATATTACHDVADNVC